MGTLAVVALTLLGSFMVLGGIGMVASKKSGGLLGTISGMVEDEKARVKNEKELSLSAEALGNVGSKLLTNPKIAPIFKTISDAIPVFKVKNIP